MDPDYFPDSVPVVVEATKDRDDFRMARCNYLTVQSAAPSMGWQLELGGQAAVFLMVGLTGVVRQPFGGGLFDSPEIIEDTLARIETRSELYVDVDDLWLPQSALRETREQIEIGQVYRLGAALFEAAFAYRAGSLAQAEFLALCDRQREALTYSETETAAFRSWHWLQVEAARAHYGERKDKGLVLQRRQGEPGTPVS